MPLKLTNPTSIHQQPSFYICGQASGANGGIVSHVVGLQRCICQIGQQLQCPLPFTTWEQQQAARTPKEFQDQHQVHPGMIVSLVYAGVIANSSNKHSVSSQKSIYLDPPAEVTAPIIGRLSRRHSSTRHRKWYFAAIDASPNLRRRCRPIPTSISLQIATLSSHIFHMNMIMDNQTYSCTPGSSPNKKTQSLDVRMSQSPNQAFDRPFLVKVLSCFLTSTDHSAICNDIRT